MDKAALGQKRRCLNCSSPFFDLNRTPIVCPKCEAVFQIVEPARSPPGSARRAFKSPAPVATSEDDRVLLAEDEEDADLPFKSAEAQEDAEDSDDVEDVEAEA